jgi:hypothetical protein
MSGMIHNAINYAQFSGRPSEGLRYLVSPQGMRSQYRIEGYFISLVVFILCMLYVFITDYVPFVERGLTRRVLFLGALSLGGAVAYMLNEIIKIKMGFMG